MKDMTRTIEILEESADCIHTMEYDSWYNANTMHSWKERWENSYNYGLYKEIRKEIQRLEEMNKE